MSTTTHKYEVRVEMKDGGTKMIYPIIEAKSSEDALKIARAQYPNANVQRATKIS